MAMRPTKGLCSAGRAAGVGMGMGEAETDSGFQRRLLLGIEDEQVFHLRVHD